jgi:hypothetical protein
MRILAVIPALYLTSTLCACAQPMPDGPPPGYGQAAPSGGYGQQQQGWSGGMQAYNGQTPPPPGMSPDQAPPPGAEGGPGMGGPGMGGPGEHAKFADKFAAANVTHDGRLTQQQAMAGGMRAVSKHFAQIDRDQKGYVTLQDIKEWHRAMHAEKAAQAGGTPGAGSYPPAAPPPGQMAPPPGGQQY